MHRTRESGQATVELVSLLPLLAVLVAALWQGVLAGQAIWLAGSAARAAARAEAIGLDASAAARGVLPETLGRGLKVRGRGDGAVDVAIAVPTVVGGGKVMTVGASARFQPQNR
jgi:hypothetical protein